MATKPTKNKKTKEISKKKGFFSRLYDRLDSRMEQSSKKSCSCCGKGSGPAKKKSCKDSNEEDDGCCNQQ